MSKGINGIIVLSKPEGITSFLAANKVRRATGAKRAGHTGTLDPMATGVLPVMLGGATKFCELLPSHDKTYRAEIMLGTVTDTLDITGTVISRSEVKASYSDFEETLKKFIGETEQIPPMYSAVSVGGKRLYELARAGVEIEREKRKVTIFSAEITGYNENRFTIDVHCSAGTYIRTLAADIGESLGCGAVLTKLSRTGANGFSTNDCVTLEQIEEAVKNGEINSLILPADKALGAYKKISVSAAQAIRFSNGGELDLDRLGNIQKTTGLYRVYCAEDKFLGIGEIRNDSDALKVRRLYVEV